MTALATPAWLKPGAPVVLWTDRGARESNAVRVTRVATVAAKSFTVEADGEPRFKIETMRARVPVSGFHHTVIRHVMPADTPVGRYWTAVLRQSVARAKADEALEQWQRTRTPEDAEAARAALAEWVTRTRELDALKLEAKP